MCSKIAIICDPICEHSVNTIKMQQTEVEIMITYIWFHNKSMICILEVNIYFNTWEIFTFSDEKYFIQNSRKNNSTPMHFR